MEIFKLTPADLDIGDAQAITALTFGNVRDVNLEFCDTWMHSDLSVFTEYCANVVTDAIAGCV